LMRRILIDFARSRGCQKNCCPTAILRNFGCDVPLSADTTCIASVSYLFSTGIAARTSRGEA
jgi:hypothetical protein